MSVVSAQDLFHRSNAADAGHLSISLFFLRILSLFLLPSVLAYCPFYRFCSSPLLLQVFQFYAVTGTPIMRPRLNSWGTSLSATLNHTIVNQPSHERSITPRIADKKFDRTISPKRDCDREKYMHLTKCRTIVGPPMSKTVRGNISVRSFYIQYKSGQLELLGSSPAAGRP